MEDLNCIDLLKNFTKASAMKLIMNLVTGEEIKIARDSITQFWPTSTATTNIEYIDESGKLKIIEVNHPLYAIAQGLII
jgi:hypothetical protein